MSVDSVLFIAAYWLDHCGKHMISTRQQQEPLTQHNTHNEAIAEIIHEEFPEHPCRAK